MLVLVHPKLRPCTTVDELLMAVTGESVEERKERLSEEAEHAGVQAHAPDVERIADDEDTEDDEAFKEQQLLRKAQEKIHAKHRDRLAKV